MSNPEIDPKIKETAIALAQAVKDDYLIKQPQMGPREPGHMTDEQECMILAIDCAITASFQIWERDMSFAQIVNAVNAALQDFITRNAVFGESSNGH